MIELPKTKVQATSKSPKRLILFSAPKVGKTTVLSQLENNLIIDLEQGSGYVDALKVSASNLDELKEVKEALVKANEANGGKPVYKYGSIDTVTALEDMVKPLSLLLYQQTPMGKAYKGDILNLPNGAGYKYLRDAFEMIIVGLEPLFDHLILVGHLKEKMIEKEGKEVESRMIDLTGKLGSITSSKADAIGHIYRDGNDVRVNFASSSGVICGARPEHLRGQDIVLSTMDDKGKITTHWDRIFVD
jgi:hypothetical protein